jgi:ketosteroid isomerase-like protein
MSEQTVSRTAAEVVEDLLKALETIDVEVLKELVDQDVEVIEPEGLPYGGVYRGADAFFGDLLPEIAGPFEIGVEDAKVFDGGDAAAANMTVVYTSRRTGETIRMPYVEIYGVTDGLISKIDVYPQDVTALTEWMDANR